MGSSPVTATIGPQASRLLRTVEEFLGSGLDDSGPERPHRLVVAFSGGPDSLALLWALVTATQGTRTELLAAHVDHRMDPGSPARAAMARSLAERLDVAFQRIRPPEPQRPPRYGREAEARRRRYEALGSLATEIAATGIVTAHHADDQAETVCLRLAGGSGLAGLAGMYRRRGRLHRPLLGLRHAALVEALAELGLDPIEDPTNRDLSLRRNFVRHRLLPALEPGTTERLLSLAEAAAGAGRRIEAVLEEQLPLLPGPEGPGYDRESLGRLPDPLLSWAMARLHRAYGQPYPPSAGAVETLANQLGSGGEIRCSAGANQLWEQREGRLELVPTTDEIEICRTGSWPEPLLIDELGLELTFERRPVAEWMRRGERMRTALRPDIAPGTSIEVRSRRPGDRLRPLGCDFEKRLKEILIDAKVPRRHRSRLPLLVIGNTIAWVPGVTIDERFKLQPTHREAWVAQLTATET